MDGGVLYPELNFFADRVVFRVNSIALAPDQTATVNIVHTISAALLSRDAPSGVSRSSGTADDPSGSEDTPKTE